jgi:hypothetical protein
MGGQSAPIPEKVTSALGRIIPKDEGRSMLAVKGHFRPPSGEEWGKGQLDNLVSMFVCIYRCDARE